MISLQKEWPGLARVAVLLAVAALTTIIANRLGQSVQLGIAIVYGVAVAAAMRWPIVLPGSGYRLVLLTGLFVEAMWHYGYPTALVMLCVEFSVRMVTLYSGPFYWEWRRPLTMAGVLLAGYLVYLEMPAGPTGSALPLLQHFQVRDMVLVYSGWFFMQLFFPLFGPPPQQHDRLALLSKRLMDTWWTPLVFLIPAGLMDLVRSLGLPLEIPAALALVWLQAQLGPIFTALHQERSVFDLLRRFGQSGRDRGLIPDHVVQYAHAIARAMPLTGRELHNVRHAAMLQDIADRPPGIAPWLEGEPTPEEREAIKAHTEAVYQRIRYDGALAEVAETVRHRFAAYDGTGFPELRGDVIPPAAQVLWAANAICWLQNRRTGWLAETPAAAVEWLQRHHAPRFNPAVLRAMNQAFVTRSPFSLREGISESVQQLRCLVANQAVPSTLYLGLRHLLHRWRGLIGPADQLPAEVQAVARLSTAFSSSTDLTQIARVATQAVGELMQAKVVLSVQEAELPPLTLRVAATHGFSQMDLPGRTTTMSGDAMIQAVVDQVPVQVADALELQTPLCQEIARLEGVRSLLLVPLICRGRTVGMLAVAAPNTRWFSPREVGLVHLMAGLAATALDNARLIREAEERLVHISDMKVFTDTLLDNLYTSIIVVDPEGRVVIANASARAKFLEQPPVGSGETLPDEFREAFRVEVALGGQEAPERDVVWREQILEAQSVPLRDGQGVLLGAICLARDVTGIRRMEQHVHRVEKLAAIGQMAAGAAHEIRNPLTSIRGFIQLLQMKATQAPQDYFKIILREIDRIDSIIRDLLLLARPAKLELTPTRLDELLREIILLHQSQFEKQGIQVTEQMDPSVGPVPLDVRSVRQVFLNLVINAMQAMPFGGTLSFTVARTEQGDVVAAVTDTGIGIAPENLRHLFVPFYTTKEEGTGLGLALCHSIVQSHNGRIDVVSAVGQGTTFRIILPGG